MQQGAREQFTAEQEQQFLASQKDSTNRAEIEQAMERKRKSLPGHHKFPQTKQKLKPKNMTEAEWQAMLLKMM